MGFGKSAKKTYMSAKKKAFGDRGVKGRYYRVGAVKGLQNLAKDVEMIKSRLNVEKKHKDRDVITYPVGQVNQNSDGALAMDITPVIAQGTDSDERVGNSLKLTGITLPMSLTQMDENRGDRRVRITLLRVKAADNGVSAQEALEQVWDTNPLTGLRDFNAPRAFRNSKSDGISVLRSMVCYVPAPNTANAEGAGSVDTERMVKNLRLSVKLQDILRFEQSSDTYPQGIRYIIVFQANAGNVNTSANSTLDVPVTYQKTGLTLRLGQRNWWVDN